MSTPPRYDIQQSLVDSVTTSLESHPTASEIPSGASFIVESPTSTSAIALPTTASSTVTTPGLDFERGNAVAGSSGSSSVGMGGGRKASLSLQLFKETARADEEEKREKAARYRNVNAPTSSAFHQVSPLKKGKERERDRDRERDRASSSPLPFEAIPYPRSITSKSRSGSPRISHISPAKPLNSSPKNPQTSFGPSGLANSRPSSPYPYASGLSNSRPVSPHSQSRTRTGSPVPELALPTAALATAPSPSLDSSRFDSIRQSITSDTSSPPFVASNPQLDKAPITSASSPILPLKLVFSGRTPKAQKAAFPATHSDSDSEHDPIKAEEKRSSEEGLFGSEGEMRETESDNCSSTESESEDDEDWSGEDEEGDGEDEVASRHQEKRYEVDVGEILSGDEATASLETRAGAKLVDGGGRNIITVPLEPFDHQVGGHSHIFRFSKKAVCKVSLRSHLSFHTGTLLRLFTIASRQSRE